MNFENVKISLEKQYNSLLKLHETAQAKQRLLIQYNQDKFDALIDEEERIISEIAANEKERLSLVAQLKKNLPSSISTNNITEILKNKEIAVNLVTIKEIESITAKIKEITGNIKSQNEKNMYLITASSKFLKELITTVMSENKNNVLDRRM